MSDEATEFVRDVRRMNRRNAREDDERLQRMEDDLRRSNREPSRDPRPPRSPRSPRSPRPIRDVRESPRRSRADYDDDYDDDYEEDPRDRRSRRDEEYRERAAARQRAFRSGDKFLENGKSGIGSHLRNMAVGDKRASKPLLSSLFKGGGEEDDDDGYGRSSTRRGNGSDPRAGSSYGRSSGGSGSGRASGSGRPSGGSRDELPPRRSRTRDERYDERYDDENEEVVPRPKREAPRSRIEELPPRSVRSRAPVDDEYESDPDFVSTEPPRPRRSGAAPSRVRSYDDEEYAYDEPLRNVRRSGAQNDDPRARGNRVRRLKEAQQEHRRRVEEAEEEVTQEKKEQREIVNTVRLTAGNVPQTPSRPSRGEVRSRAAAIATTDALAEDTYDRRYDEQYDRQYADAYDAEVDPDHSLAVSTSRHSLPPRRRPSYKDQSNSEGESEVPRVTRAPRPLAAADVAAAPIPRRPSVPGRSRTRKIDEADDDAVEDARRDARTDARSDARVDAEADFVVAAAEEAHAERRSYDRPPAVVPRPGARAVASRSLSVRAAEAEAEALEAEAAAVEEAAVEEAAVEEAAVEEAAAAAAMAVAGADPSQFRLPVPTVPPRRSLVHSAQRVSTPEADINSESDPITAIRAAKPKKPTKPSGIIIPREALEPKKEVDIVTAAATQTQETAKLPSKARSLKPVKSATVIAHDEEEEEAAFLAAARARLRTTASTTPTAATSATAAISTIDVTPLKPRKTPSPPPPRRGAGSDNTFAVPPLRPPSPRKSNAPAMNEAAQKLAQLRSTKPLTKPPAEVPEAIRQKAALKPPKPAMKPSVESSETELMKAKLRARSNLAHDETDPRMVVLTEQLRQLKPRSQIVDSSSEDDWDERSVGSDSSSSLSHLNKNRAKGPKRRLPTQ